MPSFEVGTPPSLGRIHSALLGNREPEEKRGAEGITEFKTQGP